MDRPLLDDTVDSQLPCDVGTDLVFPVTFTSPASYLVTTFRLYSTFCIAFMVREIRRVTSAAHPIPSHPRPKYGRLSLQFAYMLLVEYGSFYLSSSVGVCEYCDQCLSVFIA